MTPVETEERFNGGTILLPQSVREGMASYQCTVLGVGLPEICEDKKCQRPHDHERTTRPADSYYAGEGIYTGYPDGDRIHPIPPELVVGAWVLVKPRCYIDASHPTETQYFVHINNVEAVFVQSTEASAEV